MIFNGFIELIAVGVIPMYVRVITEPSILTRNNYILQYFPNIAFISLKEALIYGGIILLVIYLIKLGVNILNGYFQERFIRGREMRISIDLLRRYLYAPLVFHLQRNSAELISNAQIEVQTMNNGFIVPILKSITQIFILPFIIFSLLIVNPVVSIVTMLILGFAVGSYNKFIRKPLLKSGKLLQKARSLQLKSINQALGGIKELKLLKREVTFLNAYKRIMHDKHIATLKTQTISRLNSSYLEFIALMGMLLIAILVGISGGSSDLIASMITFFGLAMFRLKQSIGIFLDGYTAARVNHITIRPIYTDMTTIEMSQNAKNVPIIFSNILELNNIEFIYPGSKQKVLHDINLQIKKGECIGLVGGTGAGKTTLIDVILGLLKPQMGVVSVDGKNIFENLSGWHQIIGYIPQQIFLLDDTIRSNVSFGLPILEIDDSSVWEALETAQLASFIRQLPDGLDTIIGERGVRLSGGQRQRIGIARALYHKPNVLVMDEATSALDNKTEKLFIKALEQLRNNYTMIIIAHRLTTIEKCDRIIILDKGQIKEIGTYDYLINKSIAFKEFAK